MDMKKHAWPQDEDAGEEYPMRLYTAEEAVECGPTSSSSVGACVSWAPAYIVIRQDEQSLVAYKSELVRLII